MRPFTKKIAPSSILPLTLAEAEAHCKLGQGEDSDYLTALIQAVAGLFERESKQALMQAEYVTVLRAWTTRVEGLLHPNTTISKVEYIPEVGEVSLLPAERYELSVLSPGTAFFAQYMDLPAVRYTAREGIRIYYTAGYESADQVPAEIKQWLKLVLLHFYENRQPSLLGSSLSMQEVPMSANWIMDTIREPTL